MRVPTATLVSKITLEAMLSDACKGHLAVRLLGKVLMRDTFFSTAYFLTP